MKGLGAGNEEDSLIAPDTFLDPTDFRGLYECTGLVLTKLGLDKCFYPAQIPGLVLRSGPWTGVVMGM